MLRPVRAFVLALALSACDSPTESVTPVPGDPVVQRLVWEQQGIDDYRYLFSRGCMCDDPLPLVRVQVRDGRLVEVREAETGRLVPRERWQEVATVDQVFDHLTRAREAGETPVATFHPTFGYPMRVMLGQFEFDGGVSYYLDRLDPLE